MTTAEKIALVLTGSLLPIMAAFGQDYQYVNYNEANGLATSEIYQVFEDSRGFVWMAGDNGVDRFDGRDFTHFNSAKGLPDNTNFGFYESKSGEIWVRSFSRGLFQIQGDTVLPYRHNPILLQEIGSALINTFFFDEKNTLYLSTSMEGMALSIDSAGVLSRLVAKSRPDNLFYKSLKQGPLYGLWGTAKKIKYAHVNDDTYEVLVDDPLAQVSPVMTTFEKDGDLYLTFNKNIWKKSGSELKKIAQMPNPIISTHVDQRGDIWIGLFTGGLMRFSDLMAGQPFSIPLLQNYSVSSFLMDREGGLWISTLDRGVFYFPDIRIQNRENPNNDKVTTVTTFRDRVILGNYAGDLYELDERNSRLLTHLTPPITSLYTVGDQFIWASDAKGNHWLRQNGNFAKRDLANFGFKGIATRSEGYVGATTKAVYHMDSAGHPVLKMVVGGRISAIETVANLTLVGTPYGLSYHFTGARVDSSISVLEARITCIRKTNDSLVMIGTHGNGAYLFNVNRRAVSRLRIDPAQNIYDVEYGYGAAWLATEQGVIMVDLVRNESIRRINKRNGLASDKVNHLALNKNMLWAFTDLGVSVVPLRIFTEKVLIPETYLKKVVVNNRSYQGDLGGIPPQGNNIVLLIGSISFREPTPFFRYRMSPEDEWTNLLGQEITFSDIPSGSYTVEVESSMNGVAWQQPFNIKFSIEKHWWESGFVKTLVVIGFLSGGFLIYRARVNSIRRKHNYLELINSHQQRLIDSEIQTQERERKRIAKDLHDGVGTSLSSIKLMMVDLQEGRGEAKKIRAREIEENLTDVISEIKRIVYDLHPPALERYGLQVGLKNLVENINSHNMVTIHFDYYGQKEVSSMVSITIFRIIQELINNTLKHAKASEIRIHVNQFDDEINIMYEDNGIGMIGSRFTGLGLHSIESRIRSLHGRMNWESNHRGTFYNFDVPLR